MSTDAYICIYMYMCVCVSVYIYMYVHVCVCVRALCLCINTSTNTSMYTNVYTHTRIYIYIYICACVFVNSIYTFTSMFLNDAYTEHPATLAKWHDQGRLEDARGRCHAVRGAAPVGLLLALCLLPGLRWPPKRPVDLKYLIL